MPASQRSILQAVPGVPAFVAVLIAAGATLVGILICAARGDDLTRVFAVCYFVGCVVAVLVVRYRGLFTAVVQPPLLLFVAVPLAHQFMSDETGTSIKDILLNVAIPLVNRFPLMLFTTLVTLVIGGYRVYQAHSGPAVAKKPSSRERSARNADARREEAGRGRADRSTRSRRETRESATPRSTPKPAAGRTGAPRARDPRQTPRPAQERRRTPPPEPSDYSGASRAPSVPAQGLRTPPRRSASDVPAHPMPQVRYRNREGLANEA